MKNVFYDGQAEPGTTRFARATLVDAIEALSQSRNMFGSDADAGVFHLEDRTVGVGTPAQPDAPARRCVANRVGHEIRKGTAQLFPTAANAKRGCLYGDRMTTGGQRPRFVAKLAHKLTDVHLFVRQCRFLRLKARKKQQILDQATHAVCMFVHSLQMMAS